MDEAPNKCHVQNSITNKGVFFRQKMTFLYILTIPRGVEQELPTDDDVHHLGSGVRSQHLSIASIKV